VDSKELSLLIKDFFPEQAIDYVAKQIISLNFRLVVSKKRFSKLGVFKPSRTSDKHIISINGDLNNDLFYLVYLHEVAHLIVWNNYKRRVAPHGNEWKEQYYKILVHSINNNFFSDEIKQFVAKSLSKPNFHNTVTRDLYRIEKDSTENNNLLRVKDLPDNCTFTLLNKRNFKLIQKIRTRYKCQDLNNGRFYLVHSLAEVKNYCTT
jgi:SprT protein